jgi:hypothetical protein
MPRSDNSPVPYDEEEDAEMDGENANKIVNEVCSLSLLTVTVN